jgi:hypothetical protein
MQRLHPTIDLQLDSTPILHWLAQARRAGSLAEPALRRSLLARMIWQASYQRSPGLIDNVAYLLGGKVWGAHPRATLAADLLALRRALAAAGHRLRYSNQSGQKGFYVQGRPPLDPQLVKGICGAMAEVDPAQMAILRRLTPAQRFAQAMSMIEFVHKAGARRLRHRQPSLSEQEALRLARQGKVRA